jgi:hypothetical protein
VVRLVIERDRDLEPKCEELGDRSASAGEDVSVRGEESGKRYSREWLGLLDGSGDSIPRPKDGGERRRCGRRGRGFRRGGPLVWSILRGGGFTGMNIIWD